MGERVCVCAEVLVCACIICRIVVVRDDDRRGGSCISDGVCYERRIYLSTPSTPRWLCVCPCMQKQYIYIYQKECTEPDGVAVGSVCPCMQNMYTKTNAPSQMYIPKRTHRARRGRRCGGRGRRGCGPRWRRRTGSGKACAVGVVGGLVRYNDGVGGLLRGVGGAGIYVYTPPALIHTHIYIYISTPPLYTHTSIHPCPPCALTAPPWTHTPPLGSPPSPPAGCGPGRTPLIGCVCGDTDL